MDNKVNEKLKQRIQDQEEELILKSRESEFCRARSVTVGSGNGGVTEIMMRSANGYMWQIMQPVEIIEFIHTLAGAIGCQVAIQPRKDFASWRNWKYSDAELEHYREGGGALVSRKVASGWPPYASDPFPHASRALKMPKLEKQPGVPSEPIKLEQGVPDISGLNEIGKDAIPNEDEVAASIHIGKEYGTKMKKPILDTPTKYPSQDNHKEKINE
jgi:hypothetical protein